MPGKIELPELQRLLTSHELPEEPRKTQDVAEGAFSDMLKTLGLSKYYPSKLSLSDAMVIRKVTEHPEVVDLPWIIIHSLLMIDYRARDKLLPAVTEVEEKVAKKVEVEDDLGLSDFLLETQDTGGGKDDNSRLNPLDILVVIFACCDNFLKQTLAQKMFICKLAIPFLYPLGSKGKIMMSLWSLRTITVQWQTKQNAGTEMPVTDISMPLVTFVRLGRPPFSKSKLINDIINNESHDTFFNKDCKNGNVDRKLADGLVECSWFIKDKNKKEEHLPSTTMFLNLRGDASSLEKEMQVLQEISSVVFIIVTAQELASSSNTNTCQRILNSHAKVILFLISGNNPKERQTCIKAVGEDLIKEKRACVISSTYRNGEELNACDLQTITRRRLSEAVTGDCSGKDSNERVRLAKQRGILIDEHDDKSCLKGKALAEDVLRHIKGKQIAKCKDLALPLQGDKWTEYCKLLKKQHRVSERDSESSSADQANDIKVKMDNLREEQVEMCQKLTPVIKDFISSIQHTSRVVLYFLKWMAMFLDEISRTTLPNLRKEFHDRWTEFHEAKQNQVKENTKQLKMNVDHAENMLATASLGLEHLFRELGQIYEAVKSSRRVREDTKKVVEYLPKLAAKLLLKGNPLELVDGDASSVPITWVKAVLRQLGNIVGKKRLFVLSVLGIQSSGKSTLLNTMFGLQFAVSAGRCTRGVYMQLIPVDDHAELPFEYLVILDTEGLRAPELEQLKHHHDNELATLVIGLGDVTMINVKGENTAEIKDILQIVVHAFLRMNTVSKNIKNHRSCIFVHQNVSSVNADSQMMQGRKKILENLDNMAKEAAKSESISDVNRFTQIINFDVQNNVWYFSDLWHGDPPMAPANTGYSQKVFTVRQNVLEKIAKEQTTFLTTSDFSDRIADLWKGVLNDDFVFSFRNSLEVKAFNALQSEYSTLEWELQDQMKFWLIEEERNLKVCDTVHTLEEYFQTLMVKRSKVLDEKAEVAMTGLKDYINKNNLKEIIIQWKQSKLHKLELAIDEMRNESQAALFSIKEACRLEILQSGKWQSIEERIMQKATTLAENLRIETETMSEAELEERFDTMWLKMVKELAISSNDKEERMDLLMEKILYKSFHAYGGPLRRELEHNPLINQMQTHLEGSITLNDVRDEDISMKATWSSYAVHIPIPGLRGYKKTHLRATKMHARITAVSQIGIILHDISTYLQLQSNRDTKFQQAYAKEIINMLNSAIESFHRRLDCNFTMLPQFVVKLAVHVSRHCVKVFNKMQSDYLKEHGVKAKVEKYRKTAWTLFKNMVKQSTEEVIAGDTLCTQLNGFIEEAVKKEIPRKVAREILQNLEMKKYSLLVRILDEFARKDDFSSYKSYINTSDTKMFVLGWLIQYSNEQMFEVRGATEKQETDTSDEECDETSDEENDETSDEENDESTRVKKPDDRGISRYAKIAELHVIKIMRCISQSVEDATEHIEKDRSKVGDGKAMKLWVEMFCKGVMNEIAVPLSDLKQVYEREVVDFNHLKSIILDQLGKVEADVICTFADETGDTVNWHEDSPPKLVIDRIWGCDAQCPFCNEPCINTNPSHFVDDKQCHTCLQHRPNGIAGLFWEHDGKVGDTSVYEHQLLTDTCGFCVQCRDLGFYCRNCKYECRKNDKCKNTEMDKGVRHNYADIKTYLEEWDIAPDPTNGVSKYWMWFMNKYQHELKDLYNAKLPKIPEPWKTITMEEALDDLRTIHN